MWPFKKKLIVPECLANLNNGKHCYHEIEIKKCKLHEYPKCKQNKDSCYIGAYYKTTEELIKLAHIERCCHCDTLRKRYLWETYHPTKLRDLREDE